MNILLLSWRGPKDPNAGGAEYVAIEHAKAWIKAGHSVTFFTSYFTGAKKNEDLDHIRIIRRGYILLGVQIEAFFWYLFGRHENFDLVIDHFHGIPFFTPLFIRKKKIAVIHEVAKEVWFLNQVKYPLNKIIGFIGYYTEPLVIRLFYKSIPFITGSESTKADLVSFGIPKKNISIIHHAISTKKRNILNNKDKIVVFLGSLAKDKGIEDAIEVFSILNKGRMKWKCWVIGKGDPTYINNLKMLINSLGLNKKITFWGFVSDDKKYELLSKAYVLLNPSYKEGWGLVNIEANAMGTPVVGYDVAGTKDSVINGKTGLLSKVGDYKDLADNILKLGNNNKLYNKLQKESVVWSESFKWEDLTKISLKYIEKTVSEI